MKFSKYLVAPALLTSMTSSVMACPNCFGAAGDPITESIGAAIMFLLVIILGTVGGIIAFFVTIARRTQKYEQQLQEGNAEWGVNPELLEDQR